MVSSIISKCFNLFFLILCSGEILDFVVYSRPIQQDCVLPLAQTKNIYLGPQAPPIPSSLPFYADVPFYRPFYPCWEEKRK